MGEDCRHPRGLAAGQGREHGGHGIGYWLVFPDADDFPACGRQRGIGDTVTLNVPAQLRIPVPDVDGRLAAMLRAAVPEAAVDEHSDPASGERDIGPDPIPARKVQAIVLAVAVAPAVQSTAQRKLGLGVGAPIGAHVGRATWAGGMRIVGHGV